MVSRQPSLHAYRAPTKERRGATRKAIRVGLFTPGLGGPLSGVGRYAVELARGLATLKDGPEVVLLTAADLGPLADEGFCRAPIHDRALSSALTLGNRVLSSLVGTRIAMLTLGSGFVPIASKQLGLDIVHDVTNIIPFAFGAGGARTVVTIHDLISWSYPGSNDWMDDLIQRRWLPRSLPSADAVITVSRASQEDVIRYMKVPADRVRVVHSGVSPRFRPPTPDEVASVRARYGLPEGYILFVGRTDERKNLHLLVEAYARLWQAGERRALVIVGPGSDRYSAILGELRALYLEQSIILTGYLPERDLPALYGGAYLFVYPSRYEGFGLPLLEAMACGTPIVCSNVSSMPEVVGNAAATVDPYDLSMLVHEMQRLLNDAAAHEELRRRGLERAAEFTWNRAAKQTMDVYREVCQGSLSATAVFT